MIQLRDCYIEKIRISDAVGIHHLMTSNAERFQRYFPKTLEQNSTIVLAQSFAEQKVQEFTNKEEFLFVIKQKTTKKVVGLIYIKALDWIKRQGEFAYCLASKYEGKGVMSSGIRALSGYAFTNLKLNLLQIIVFKENIGSVKVAQNCNFVWQRTLLKEHTPPNELPLDMELYELNILNF